MHFLLSGPHTSLHKKTFFGVFSGRKDQDSYGLLGIKDKDNYTHKENTSKKTMTPTKCRRPKQMRRPLTQP